MFHFSKASGRQTGAGHYFAAKLDLRRRFACAYNVMWPANLATGNLTVIAFLTLEIHIEAAHSLKDKRQVLRSLKDRLRAHFNVAVSELDHTDLWQRATIGVVSISDSRDYLAGLMANVEREATRVCNNNGGEVTDAFTDYL